MRAPTETEVGLLGNTSDDEDDFASFGQQRVVGDITTNSIPVNQSTNSLIDDIPVSEQSNGQTKAQTEPEVDFFNMNSANNLANDVDLMHIDKTPSNVDLLVGGKNDDDFFAGNTTNKRNNDDAFDPFHSFDNKPKQNIPPVKVTAAKSEFDSFDPFADMNGSAGQTENSGSKDPDGDLMGDWNDFMAPTSSPNISRNSSSSNLQAGGMPTSGSTGSFQQMGMGGNIPRNNSGTFQGMAGGGGMSRNNSGTFQTMGGQGGSTASFGKPPAPNKPSDPFADLGGFGKTSPTPLNQQAAKPAPQSGGPSPMGSGYKGMGS